MKSVLIGFLVGFISVSALAGSVVLGDDFEKYLIENMEKHKIVGAAVGVVRDGKLVYAKGFGYRDVAKKLPVTPKTLFSIGSTTKAFTATAVGLMVNRGLITYDQPIVSILPDFELSNPVTTQTATLRDLLGHMTGVPRHDAAWFLNFKNREDLFRSLYAFPYRKELREEWEYNNLMYLASGVLVDRISGQTWENFVQANILNPLEMKNTNFSISVSEKSDDFSYAYQVQGDKIQQLAFANTDSASAAGGINSNLEDMSHWLWTNISKGEWKNKTVIPASVLEETHKPYADMKDEKGNITGKYAQGWFVDDFRGHPIINHDGAISGFLTAVAFSEELNAGVIVFVNTRSLHPSLIMRSVFDRLFNLKPEDWLNKVKSDDSKKSVDRKFEKPAQDLKEYVGTYDHPGYGDVTVALNPDTQAEHQLIGNYHGIVLPLRHDENNRWVSANVDPREEDIVFEPGLDGKPRSVFILFQKGVAPIEFRRQGVE